MTTRNDVGGILGEVRWELHDESGLLLRSGVEHNLVTQVGDQLYGERGVGITTTAIPVGMKLGTGSTATAKTGAGAALVTYLSNSQQAFDATFPSSALGSGRVISFKVTYAAGKATSAATAITEAVIYNDTTADATSTAANTISRVLIAGVGSKQSTDTLTITWTHTLLGA